MTETTEAKVDAAQTAALELANESDEARQENLQAIADAIDERRAEVLEANEKDVEAAEEMLEAGEYSQALVDRLKLSDAKLDSIIEMVRSVAGQEDPLGKTLTARELDDGLDLYKVSVPIGVIGTVFESRPDALVQIAALSLRSGNAVILKGGSEASHSNRVLYEIIREATADLPDGWAQLIEAREDVDRLLGMDDSVDLLMPRGSSAFVSYIQDNTSIPVLGHTEGVCHVYVDDAADLDMATDIAYDAKVQYPAVCNAVETLLVHEDVAEEYLPDIAARYAEADVEMRGDEATRSVLDRDIEAATDDDWTSEYGDLIVAIKVVDSLESAIDHINTNGSKHTESIVTEDDGRASTFMRRLDSASVFHNASTRFSDGYRFGLGAEVGISTGKIHARGPVGLKGLTTYKYHLEGDGHLVATYAGEDAKPFSHEEFDGEWSP
ncbi:gamma-glutamyl phosphate reductase [Natronomonas pharaonis DSM 2160]|uniref:Gamma-glutamyl phosphate reductase n=1 Tax=Natronomonas pharaonis (strain ATCC 35678 / DSM 2160 / CIP 103997 / JCM 8858 / NBRC 14720 / NCIMB 2260 / Gabara) TaxID=348780 RepID=PROA_NATPD|nr:glutamate-5-semialdehyde dehydrogenase [Natronomonas pharaonis]Q3IP72.1 RecName: Full=Gamma-glutamyl phosphate reductase; Short=GPR; AltName: Full=Glutamate-5-semialdehyde dehydrogenase; AltName: Full=Glutamyl-gamma-semialdehyde dehydrogenase; Short=GSA dehydrogenase [Natronomonas pharaonis DSM 2160]CAI50080.1 gamma-glutamyl phosphate reductase [Natronomonas pharaonis DSM 2160]